MGKRRFLRAAIKAAAFLSIIVLCGIISGLPLSRQGEGGNFSKAVLRVDYSFFTRKTSKARSTMILFMEQTMQLFLFQLAFGFKMAGRFKVAGAYYFTRQPGAGRWFFKEAGWLMVVSMAGAGLYFAGKVGISLWGNSYVLTWESVWIFLIVVSLHGLYLFSFTLLINILSIQFGGIVGFLPVMMLQVLLMGPLSFIGKKEYRTLYGGILIKANPISHLMYSWHSGNGNYLNGLGIPFPIWESYVYFGILIVLCTAAGCMVTRCRARNIF